MIPLYRNPCQADTVSDVTDSEKQELDADWPLDSKGLSTKLFSINGFLSGFFRGSTGGGGALRLRAQGSEGFGRFWAPDEGLLRLNC